MKITLKVKIFAIIILLITMALIIGLFAFLSMKNAANTTEDMSQKYMYVYTLNTTIGLNAMDFRRFFYIIQRTPNNANLEIITNMGNKTTGAMSQMHTFMQDETNKNLMPEVAAIVPEFNTAVNTYISTAVNQLTLRVQNAPKEDEFLKNIDNFIKESDNFRDTVRKMINNAETPEEAIRYFRNYDRISDINIDMGTVKDDFSNAVALNSLKDLLLIEPLLKNINSNLNNIRDNLNNRNLINNVTAMINSSEKLIQNYNHLKDVYTKMQNIAVSRTASLKTMEEMIEKVNDIAGIRIICPFQENVYMVRNILVNNPKIKILNEKDYIQKPKKSGYSSLHLIIEIPVETDLGEIYAKVEIQIRTMAMDFWASLEHELKYKNNNITKVASKKLIKVAKVMNKLDYEMSLLANEIR